MCENKVIYFAAGDAAVDTHQPLHTAD